MATTPDKPLRADAQRNRDRLLAAASDAFAECGADVSLEAVAKRAGVGIGTLYRHFPTRDTLVEAAYRAEVEHLAQAASELLAEHRSDEALALWLDRFVAYAAAKRGMLEALRSLSAGPEDLFASTRVQITGALTTLLDAAHAEGTVREDVEPGDIMRATGAIWAMNADEDWQANARKLLALLMDGLRAGAPAARA